MRDLGVILDSDLTLTAHVSQIVSVCYFHLRQLRLTRRSLTADTAHIMVRALIHICLDYCNGLLFGLPAGQIARLQGLPVGYRALSAQLCVSLCSHGWIFHNKSHINLLCWCTNVHMVWHQNISPSMYSPVYFIGSSSEGNKLFVPRSLTASTGPRAFCSLGVVVARQIKNLSGNNVPEYKVQEQRQSRFVQLLG